MELEFRAAANIVERYDYVVRDGVPAIVDWEPMVRQILNDRRADVESAVIAARFHNTLAAIVVDVAHRVDVPNVLLTGGCFQNRYLTERVVQRLGEAGFSAHWHQRVPPNDGGIALGQVMAAQHAIAQETACVLQSQAK
jgi:hydrogenase maturation protein HypF